MSIIAPKNLLFQRIRVGAGQRYPVVVSGNYCYVEGISFDTTNLAQQTINDGVITVKPDTIGAQARLITDHREIQFPETFSLLEFFNSGTVTVFIFCWVGVGRIRSDSPSRVVNCSSSLLTNGGGAYTIGDCVCSGPFYLGAACSPYNQRGKLRTVTVQKNQTTTDAVFELWLFARQGTGSTTDNSPFVLGTTPAYFPYDYLGTVALPAFVTGGAGSTLSFCFVSGIDLDIWSAPTDAGGYADGTIFGQIVARAAYNPGVSENIVVSACVEWD